MHQRITRLLLLPVTLVWLAAAGAAQEEEAPGLRDDTRNCIATRRIRKARALDERNILFYYSNRTIFHNVLRQACGEIRLYRISYATTTGQLCEGDSVGVLRNESMGIVQPVPNCRLGTFRKLGKTEVEALREAERNGRQPSPERPDQIDIGVTQEDPAEPET